MTEQPSTNAASVQPMDNFIGPHTSALSRLRAASVSGSTRPEPADLLPQATIAAYHGPMPSRRFEPIRGAEFPHDNPEIFSGVAWLAQEPCAAPSAVPARRQTEGDEPTVVEGVELLSPAMPGLVAAGPPSDLDCFIAALVEVALGRGETRLAARLREFLSGGELVLEGLSERAERALLDQGFATCSSGQLRLVPDVCQMARAWTRTLSGQASDLEECGDSTLDGWAAALLGACLGDDAAGVAQLRRVLRQSGVAAFGMLAA